MGPDAAQRLGRRRARRLPRVPCKDGRVAIAALEPHFARALFAVAGLPPPDARAPFAPQAREAIAAWALSKTRKQLDALAAQHDIPLHTLSK